MSALRAQSLDINCSTDRELPQPPEDTVSCVAWSPVSDLLAVSSWDQSVRLYEVNSATGDAQGRAMYRHEGVVLSVSWWSDGSKVVSGGSDKAVRSYDLQSGQVVQIGAHDADVTGVAVVDVAGQPIVASVSYDKTLKYWDMRSQQPVATVQLPDRATNIAAIKKLMVIACINKQLILIDLNNPGTVFKVVETPLKSGSESLACMADGAGYALGTAEGRCAVQFVNPPTPSSNFTFKCHRKVTKLSQSKSIDDVFCVEALAFHPTFNTLATAGGDGTLTVWDAVNRQRLGTLKAATGEPITAIAFSTQGTFVCYAQGYDWAKGYQYNTPDKKTMVKIHKVNEWEVKPKQGR